MKEEEKAEKTFNIGGILTNTWFSLGGGSGCLTERMFSEIFVISSLF